MCGIAGYWALSQINPNEGKAIGLAMARAMHQRGPDFQNCWVDDRVGLVMAHARLSVIDLSAAANQPFISDNSDDALVYNGEVYNYLDLRNELESYGVSFRTNSDTEVVLEACKYWGVIEATKRLVGMFAFAFWDANQKKLSLSRDPVGIKPLYYGSVNGVFLFASTLSAFKQYPNFKAEVSFKALRAYLDYCYVPAPYSILNNINKLKPGHVLTIDSHGQESLECYWDALEVAKSGMRNQLDGSDAEITKKFDSLLRKSIQGCLISDVPLGAFLSGGIDSSLVAALMQAEGTRSAKTFTVGFADHRYDESDFARQVAKYLGCEHTEIICKPADAQSMITNISECYDEPFADSSQIPTMLLSKMTRQHVTVALSGDGGDELFGGYDRYFWMERFEEIRRKPLAIQHLLGYLTRTFGREVTFPLLRKLPRGNAFIVRADAIYHLSRMLQNDDRAYLYRTTPMSVCTHTDCQLLQSGEIVESLIDDAETQKAFPSLIPWMQFIDQQTYLPDDILQKVDRASMAYSLEARVPLLDHRLIEFAWQVPERLKLNGGRGKILMRNLLAEYIPKSLIDRPKRGFSIPLSDWLKKDLRDWADSLITTAADDSLLNSHGVRTAWSNFLTGQAEHTLTSIWAVLMYLQWRKSFLI